VAALAAGSVLGMMSLSAHDSARTWCDATTNECTDQRGVDARSNAIQYGNVATVLFVAGGALLSTGLVLWLTSPSSAGPRIAVSATAGGGAGVAAIGAF
jgi:hypothetical protein